jgi:hypothetical protein
VQVRGAPALLNGATTWETDAAGAPVQVAWNRLLVETGDHIVSRAVLLAEGHQPRASSSLFVQLAFGPVDDPRLVSLPFVFAPVDLDPITLQLDAATRTVLLIGNPFGDLQDFLWTVSAHAAAGAVFWTSENAPGTERQRAIPEAVLALAHGLSVRAALPSKIPGYGTYAVRSPVITIR